MDKINAAICSLRSGINQVKERFTRCKDEQAFRTYICSAITANNIELVKKVLHNTDTDIVSCAARQGYCESEKSPMHVACKTCNIEACTLLYETRFLINVVDECNRTPLWDALWRSHTSVVNFLLSKEGIDVNVIIQNDYQGLTVLMQAAMLNDTSSMIGILHCGPDPNVVDHKRKTPLHFACKNGNMECVNALLSSNAGVNSCDNEGRTPLYIACKHASTDIVSVLIKSGAEINTVVGDEYRRRKREWYVSGVKNTSDNDDYSLYHLSLYPLIVAIEKCRQDTVHILIENGADVNIKLFNQRTPLHVACSVGNLEIVTLLHQNGADMNFKDSFGKSPLFYCLRNGMFYLSLNHLIRYKPEYVPESFQSVPHVFQFFLENLEQGNQIMLYLIENGIKITCTDTKGKAVIDYAWSTFRLSSSYILLKYGSKPKWNHMYLTQLEIYLNCSKRLIPMANLLQLLLRSNNDFRKTFPMFFEILNKIQSGIHGNGPIKHTSSQELLLSQMTDMMERPQSLKDQCRMAIRNSLTAETGIEFHNRIKALCLPPILVSFLIFEDVEQYIDIRSEFW